MNNDTTLPDAQGGFNRVGQPFAKGLPCFHLEPIHNDLYVVLFMPCKALNPGAQSPLARSAATGNLHS